MSCLIANLILTTQLYLFVDLITAEHENAYTVANIFADTADNEPTHGEVICHHLRTFLKSWRNWQNSACGDVGSAPL